ncbi:MAG: hypothetical protein M3Y74_18380 [Chloroflexota bacterium]|nr:hypothetical protein [Chloroflexota bacterium]
MQLVRKQTYITPTQDRAVKRLAARYRTTEADILRKALDNWLDKEGVREGNDPFEALIGSFDGPVEVDHDDIYR